MTSNSKRTVLVIGHRNPDTDAICSALAYASFYQWQTGQDAVACYLDDLAPETAWLLRSLGLDAPHAIEDVYLRVAGAAARSNAARGWPCDAGARSSRAAGG